jgi:hypothetical protein
MSLEREFRSIGSQCVFLLNYIFNQSRRQSYTCLVCVVIMYSLWTKGEMKYYYAKTLFSYLNKK